MKIPLTFLVCPLLVVMALSGHVLGTKETDHQNLTVSQGKEKLHRGIQLIQGGSEKTEDFEKGVQLLEELGRSGYGEAYSALGWCYLNGRHLGPGRVWVTNVSQPFLVLFEDSLGFEPSREFSSVIKLFSLAARKKRISLGKVTFSVRDASEENTSNNGLFEKAFWDCADCQIFFREDSGSNFDAFVNKNRANFSDIEGRSIEPIDVIESWKLGYHIGNVLKYISRASRKDCEKTDLEKALFYLDRFMRNGTSAKADCYINKREITVEKLAQDWRLNTSLELAIMHIHSATLSTSTFYIEEAKKAINVRLKQLKIIAQQNAANNNYKSKGGK